MFASLAASAIDHTLLYRQVMRQRRVEGELELARKVVEGLMPRAFPLNRRLRHLRHIDSLPRGGGRLPRLH